MKYRQASKIVKRVSQCEERGEPIPYSVETRRLALRTWDRVERIDDARFFAFLKHALGPHGFFDFQVRCGLTLLEDRFANAKAETK